MKKKLILLTLCTIFTWVCAVAQTQTGIVRTLEKSKRPSQGIDGVTVEILEYPNSIVSKKGGKFSFTLKNKKLGDAFKVSRVTKKGYTLVDKHLQGRKFSYSQTVPIEIVMVSDKQLANDKKQIEDKALAKAKKTYEAHIAELEQQFEKKTINEKAYYAERERLLNNYDNYIKLIDEMAERYALTDYKGLSDINREILECIENAELERADSLINSKGDFNQREQELRSQMEFNKVTAELLAQSQKDAEFKLNDLAQDYYNKFTILAANYKNDSAAYYLERRANLDTTNIEWLNDAARFIEQYFANHSVALRYYQIGLNQSLTQFSEQNDWSAIFYNNIGEAYLNKVEYDMALKYFSQALEIQKKLHGTEHPIIANTYNNIGEVYYSTGQYEKAFDYHTKALEIREKTLGKEHSHTATSYGNIGKIYDVKGNHEKALEYYNIALSIFENALGEEHPLTATSYACIGITLAEKGEYDKALFNALKALNIFEKVLGTEHPTTALCYYHIGSIYRSQGKFDKALDCFVNYLKSREKEFGNEHFNTAIALYDVGSVYGSMGDYDKALEYFFKTLVIEEKTVGINHQKTADTYHGIGSAYANKGNYDEALSYQLKALDIRKQLFDSNHPMILASYNNIWWTYFRLKNYAKALEYLQKALEIRIATLGASHPEILTTNHQILAIKYAIAITNDKLQDFLLGHCLSATVGDGGPAQQQGMSGEYVLLEFGDWTEDSYVSLFDKSEEMKGKPKDIVVLKNGVISKHHFEDVMGVQLGVKEITHEERERINQLYKAWKSDQVLLDVWNSRQKE